MDLYQRDDELESNGVIPLCMGFERMKFQFSQYEMESAHGFDI